MNLKLTVFIFTAVAFLTLAIVLAERPQLKSKPKFDQTKTQTTDQYVTAAGSPERVVEEFYSPQLKTKTTDLEALSAQLTPEFKRHLEDLQKHSSLGIAPEFCAQTLPQSIVYDRAKINGTEALVFTHHRFAGSSRDNEVQLTLEKRQDRWLIASIVCIVVD